MSRTFVAVINYGAQSCRHITAVLQLVGTLYCVLGPDDKPNTAITHVILSGGPKHVYNCDAYRIPQWVLQCDVPVLGICYGMQLIAQTFGGNVIPMEKLEKGPVYVFERCDPLLVNSQFVTKWAWMNRYDRIIVPPPGFTVFGWTAKQHIAAFTDGGRWWGVQYHPEVQDYLDLATFKRFLRG